MSQIPNTIPSKRLSQAITASDSSFKLNNILAWDGTTDLSSSDFGTQAFGIFRNADGSLIELFEFDPTTIASASITISNRGLKFNGDETEVSANKIAWAANDTIVELGTNVPQLLNNFVDKGRAQIISGIKTFSALPQITAGNPVADNDIARKAYVDLTATGSATYDQNLIPGNAGATVAAGEVIYLKESDGEWYLADGSASATCENVIIGIAQGAGTDGNAISGGILIGGIDKNATYTAGSKYYITDVAGALGTSAGTVEVLVGTGDANNNLVFEHNVTLETLTANEKDALAGTSGTPSTSNKFVTNDDTSDAAGSGKIVRATGTALPALDASNLTNVPISPTVDIQTFTGDGTYTKPSGALKILVQAWGAGGGSAGINTNEESGGGGGGGYNEILLEASDVGTTEDITIGLGGIAGTSGGGAAGNGGDTTFGSLLTGFGGKGSSAHAAGVVAGVAGGGSGRSNTAQAANTTSYDSRGGGAGTTATGGHAEFGGGGGGNGNGTTGGNGGSTFRGGGGGGGGSKLTTSGAGGTSLFGGGTGGTGAINGVGAVGSQPGGGAGGSGSNAAGSRAGAAGADGQIIVTTYK